MSLFVVDVEADGPAPGLFSMVSFGAVRVDRQLDRSFYAEVAPISDRFEPEALAVSKVTREQHLAYPDPAGEMRRFAEWVKENNRGGEPVFVSDNPAFDWQWISYYTQLFLGHNPFNHSGRRVGDFCAGLEGDWTATRVYRELGVTEHTHNPADDARRVAEGLIGIADKHGVLLPGVSKASTPKASSAQKGPGI